MKLEDLKKMRQETAESAAHDPEEAVGADELRKKRQRLKESGDVVFENMQMIADESYRAADVAHNSRQIFDDLDAEFEEQTGLKKADFAFLFLATALQLGRIILINALTEVEKAGQGNTKEDILKRVQKKVLAQYDNGIIEEARPYYAPRNQIITGRGVPYDATAFLEDKESFFKGANHRFATVGHDPVLGLIIGTANILTNTITVVDESLLSKHSTKAIPLALVKCHTNHVVYDANLKNPKIGTRTIPGLMLKEAVGRYEDDREAITAALIKQIIHIGTDLYTPMGIQIPGANLILSNTNVEKLTQSVSFGDVLKAGASAGIAAFINYIIGVLHGLLYDESKYDSREVYSVKTRRILMISNTIATTSNLIWVGANVSAGDKSQIKNLDIGGLIVTMHRLINDPKFIRQVKEEFVLGKFNRLIQGEELLLKEIPAWDESASFE